MPDLTSLAQPNNQLANATPNVNTFYGADGAIQAQTINNLQVNLSLDTPEAVERFSQIFQGMTPVAQGSAEIHAATSSLQPQATTDPQLIPIQHAIEWAALDSECYCLFVLENEEYNYGAFSIAKNVALTKYTEESDLEKYRSLNAEAVQSLVGMPCIFAKRNNFYNRTDDLHPAIFGRIREIKNQGGTIKVDLRASSP